MINVTDVHGKTIDQAILRLIDEFNALEEKYTKLEVTLKHPALKDAYERYKILEALVDQDNKREG